MAELWALKLYKSKAWRGLRRALIAERGPTCEHCGKDCTMDPSELQGDHIIELTPQNVQDASIALNPSNVRLHCRECHNEHHKRWGQGTHRIYIVYGAPCSGKSTLVRQSMSRGDLVVDIDLLYQAVSGLELHDKPNSLRANVFGLRGLLIDQLRMRVGHWGDAYIIGGYPHKLERDELARKLGAELVYCDVPMEQCLANAASRGVQAEEYRGYIREWFTEYDG